LAQYSQLLKNLGICEGGTKIPVKTLVTTKRKGLTMDIIVRSGHMAAIHIPKGGIQISKRRIRKNWYPAILELEFIPTM